jgi:hypothetical protein
VARDFAKSGQGGKKKASTRKTSGGRAQGQRQAGAGSGWRWYGAGVLTGVFLSFLLYLGTLPGPGTGGPSGPDNAEYEEPAPKPRFDFYTLLPEQTIDVELEPGETQLPRAGATAATSERYLLQAGSFRQREDADRRRAELLLLGLEPRVEEARGDNGRWYRVYLGPYDSRSKMAKARSLTAGQDIDTLLLKRGAP